MDGILVIGGGPAGVSAAIYALRAGAGVTIADSGTSALKKAHLIENYYGTGPVSGEKLYSDAQLFAKELGARFIYEQMVSFSWDGTLFTAITAEGNTYTAAAAVLASGSDRAAPKIEGLSRLEGMGVSYCAVCDGFFYRGRRVAVLGAGEYALHEARYLAGITQQVIVFTNGDEPKADFTGFERHTEKIAEIFGENAVQGIRLQGTGEIPIDGVFVALGSAGSTSFAQSLGLPLDNGKIKVNERCETAIAGLFAAGDCTGGLLQVSKAVAQGAQAGISAAAFIKKKNNSNS